MLQQELSSQALSEPVLCPLGWCIRFKLPSRSSLLLQPVAELNSKPFSALRRVEALLSAETFSFGLSS